MFAGDALAAREHNHDDERGHYEHPEEPRVAVEETVHVLDEHDDRADGNGDGELNSDDAVDFANERVTDLDVREGRGAAQERVRFDCLIRVGAGVRGRWR